MHSNETRVSVICNTYNQEAYIAKTLDGFVNQKTSFLFEVLVHDDASTDSTPQIVRSYAEKYPDLIKPIYQIENQYSKKVRITAEIQMPRAKGDYIAFCEGDDYWIDCYKLQKQFDALEQHPEINICANAAYREIDGVIIEKAFPCKRNCMFSVEQVIINDGDFVATASLFFRKSMFDDDQYTFCRTKSLDYAWQIRGAMNNGMLFLGDVMSVYRVSATGSWTARTMHDLQGTVNMLDSVIQLLELVDLETDKAYHGIIEFQKNVYRFRKAELFDDQESIKAAKKGLCTPENAVFYKSYLPQFRIRKWIKYRFPSLRKLKELWG